MGSLSWSHPGDFLFQWHPCGRWHKVRCCFPADFPAQIHWVMDKPLCFWREHREHREEEHQGGFVGWEKAEGMRGVGEGRRDEGRVLWDLCSAEPSDPSGRCCSACSFCALSRSGFPLQFPGNEALEHQEQLQPALLLGEIHLDPAWVLGKRLCALAGNTEKWKEKPERDRREIWHSSKAQTGWMLLCNLLSLLPARNSWAGSAPSAAGAESAHPAHACPPSPRLSCAGREGTAHRELPARRAMAVLERMLKNGAF